uniref:Uncharacterized protein n=1 Tax=Arundo donax TaxID=35708 RepID=A0A0A9BXR4_ARUDO
MKANQLIVQFYREKVMVGHYHI